ncbi:MAG: hypothetical protein HFG73_05675 [Hungatella sp.]|nr:hypothetical protein [Hungatella sp.]
MENIFIAPKEEQGYRESEQAEMAVLRQTAKLLAEEKLIDPEEQICFLAFLREGI